MEDDTPLNIEDVFRAPIYPVQRTEVVPATELEIAAAIVVLKARTRALSKGDPEGYQAYLPLEVKAHPFRPGVGWRQAALNFIRMNREEEAKGNPISI